ncbi:hypothetical protein EDB19DRAFT_1736874 [Suillus lakei]|nr:hypothetical protein EDB19DRAFT_1736874 [Suillus lakei]
MPFLFLSRASSRCLCSIASFTFVATSSQSALLSQRPTIPPAVAATRTTQHVSCATEKIGLGYAEVRGEVEDERKDGG